MDGNQQNMLGQREYDVQRVLKDTTALHFLIAWTVFESKCFDGFLKAKDLQGFARKFCSQEFDPSTVDGVLTHFHDRYQDEQKLRNLLHDDKTPIAVVNEFKRCLSTPVSKLASADRIFAVAFVVYRFRNNMFHGNKRVQSWLGFKEQIGLCTLAMQVFVSHAEAEQQTMHIAKAA